MDEKEKIFNDIVNLLDENKTVDKIVKYIIDLKNDEQVLFNNGFVLGHKTGYEVGYIDGYGRCYDVERKNR